MTISLGVWNAGLRPGGTEVAYRLVTTGVDR
jgi:hypothetical protein